MNCKEADKFFLDYLDGVIGPGKKRALDEHISSCSSCQQKLAALANTHKDLQQAYRIIDAKASVPVGVWASMKQRLEIERKRKAFSFDWFKAKLTGWLSSFIVRPLWQKAVAVAAVIALVVMSAVVPSLTSPHIVRAFTEEELELAESSSEFGINLFNEIIKTEEGNVFISPLSVSMALGMALNGADGGTYEAMKETLALTGLTEEQINANCRSLIDLLRQIDPAVIFQIANSVWCDQGLPVRDEFITTNQQYFDAEVDTLDFGSQEAVDTINNWVDGATNGLIEDIIDEIDPTVVMFLINAIYFNGGWADKFDKANTQEQPFYLADGSTSTCLMMDDKIDIGHYENRNISVIDLPYGDGRYSMTIFLPKEGGAPLDELPEWMQPEEEEIEQWWDIDELVANFTPQNYDEWIAMLSSKRDETLLMPKFNLEYELVLNDALTALGMGVAFGAGADFSRMTDIANPELWIGEVKHKTYIEVDEEGTRAAAVTSVPGELSSISFPLVIDHPFLFVIREHESNTILFMGKMMEPVWEE